MQCVILAAGRGICMRELMIATPKPMIEMNMQKLVIDK